MMNETKNLARLPERVKKGAHKPRKKTKRYG
jgi:hypothetical protein